MKSTTKTKNNVNISKNKTVTKKNKKLNKKKHNVLNNKNKYSKSKKNIKNKKNVSKLKLSTKTLRNKKKKKENKNKRFTKKKKMYGGQSKSVAELILQFDDPQRKKKQEQKIQIDRDQQQQNQEPNLEKQRKKQQEQHKNKHLNLSYTPSTSETNVVLNNDRISDLLNKIPEKLQNKIEDELSKKNRNSKVKIQDAECKYKSKGSFGVVWEVKYGYLNFALKIPISTEILDEIEILEKIKTNKYRDIYDCKNIIPIAKFGKKSIIMIKADDNLLNLYKNTQTDVKDVTFNINLIKTIYKALECLSKIGLYYYDIKLDNILYKKNINGNIEVFLGDIGCIQNLEGMESYITATVQTPYLRKLGQSNRRNLNLYKDNPKLYYPWALSLLGLNLYFGSYRFRFYWDLSENEYLKDLESLKSLKELLYNLRCSNTLLDFYAKNILDLIYEELKSPMTMDNKWAEKYISEFEQELNHSLFTNI